MTKWYRLPTYAAVRQDSLALAFMQGFVGLLGRLKDNVK